MSSSIILLYFVTKTLKQEDVSTWIDRETSPLWSNVAHWRNCSSFRCHSGACSDSCSRARTCSHVISISSRTVISELADRDQLTPRCSDLKKWYSGLVMGNAARNVVRIPRQHLMLELSSSTTIRRCYHYSTSCFSEPPQNFSFLDHFLPNCFRFLVLCSVHRV